MRRASGVLSAPPPDGSGPSDPLSPDALIGDEHSLAPIDGVPPVRREGPLRRAVHLLSMAFGVLAAVLVVAIMLSTAADVAVRQITGSSIPGVVEYSEVLMVGLVFLGLAYAQRAKAHIGVDMFTERMPARLGHLVRAVGLMVAFVVLAVMAWETAQVAVTSFGNREFRFGLVRVPIWPARAIIPLGLVALLLELALTIWDELLGARDRAPVTQAAHPEAVSVVSDDALEERAR